MAVGFVAAGGADAAVGEAQQIEGPVRHVAGVAFGFQQIVHQRFPLGGILDFQKRERFLSRRDAPDGNEERAAQEGRIVGDLGDRQVLAAIEGGDVLVDLQRRFLEEIGVLPAASGTGRTGIP